MSSGSSSSFPSNAAAPSSFNSSSTTRFTSVATPSAVSRSVNTPSECGRPAAMASSRRVCRKFRSSSRNASNDARISLMTASGCGVSPSRSKSLSKLERNWPRASAGTSSCAAAMQGTANVIATRTRTSSQHLAAVDLFRVAAFRCVGTDGVAGSHSRLVNFASRYRPLETPLHPTPVLVDSQCDGTRRVVEWHPFSAPSIMLAWP